MKTKKLLLTWLTAGAMLVGLASCGQEPAQPAEPEVTLESIAVKSEPRKNTYFVGEEFAHLGMEVEATYSDEHVEAVANYTLDLADGYKFTQADVGDKEVTVTYEEKTAKFTVEVRAVELASISVDTSGLNKTVYRKGETLDLEGLVVNGHYNNGKTAEIAEGYTVTLPDMSREGTKEVVVSYEGFQDSFEVMVREDTWDEIVYEYFEELGFDLDLPVEPFEGMEMDIALIEDEEDGDYFEIFVDPYAYGVDEWDLFVYDIYFGYALDENREVAFYSFDTDYASYGMLDLYLLSDHNEDGQFVMMNYFVYYGYGILMYFYTVDGMDANLAQMELDLVLESPYGLGNLQETEGLLDGKLSDLAEYVLVEREFGISEETIDTLSWLLEAITYLFPEDANADYLDYAEHGVGYAWGTLDPKVFNMKEAVQGIAAVLTLDFGFEYYDKPFESYWSDGDEGIFATLVSPDLYYVVSIGSYYDDDGLEIEIEIDTTEFANDTYYSYSLIMVDMDGTASYDFLDLINSDDWYIIDSYKDVYGYFAISYEEDERTYEHTWVQMLAQGHAFTIGAIFTDAEMYNNGELLEAVNEILGLWGFETQIPDFTETHPWSLYFAATESYDEFVLYGLDNADYGEEGSFEEIFLDMILDSGEWIVDDSDYETSGYFAVSNEYIYANEYDVKCAIYLQWYTYNYEMVLDIRIDYVYEDFPTEELIEAIDNRYGEGTAAALDFEALCEPLEELDGLCIIAASKDTVYSTGAPDAIVFNYNATSDDLAAVEEFALGLAESEKWEVLGAPEEDEEEQFSWIFLNEETQIAIFVRYGYDEGYYFEIEMILLPNAPMMVLQDIGGMIPLAGLVFDPELGAMNAGVMEALDTLLDFENAQFSYETYSSYYSGTSYSFDVYLDNAEGDESVYAAGNALWDALIAAGFEVYYDFGERYGISHYGVIRYYVDDYDYIIDVQVSVDEDYQEVFFNFTFYDVAEYYFPNSYLNSVLSYFESSIAMDDSYSSFYCEYFIEEYADEETGEFYASEVTVYSHYNSEYEHVAMLNEYMYFIESAGLVYDEELQMFVAEDDAVIIYAVLIDDEEGNIEAYFRVELKQAEETDGE